MTRQQPPQRAWDDYFIPGTPVLQNKFTSPEQPYGESDPAKLATLEEHYTRTRLLELRAKPVPGRIDYDHMKAIHAYVFQDVYDWAGQERTAPNGPMFKEGHAYYPAGPALTTAAEAEYSKIAATDYLRGMNRDAFVAELAERWGELNVIHSFREGNTRTQFVFFSQLCEQAGYQLDTEAFRLGNPLRDEFVQARFHGQDTGSNARLTTVLDKAITTRPDAEFNRATAEIEHSRSFAENAESQRLLEQANQEDRRAVELRASGSHEPDPEKRASATAEAEQHEAISNRAHADGRSLYDSAERRDKTAHDLADKGIESEVVAIQMRADTSQAKPATETVKAKSVSRVPKTRKTQGRTTQIRRSGRGR
jgi:cell filamentation protein